MAMERKNLTREEEYSVLERLKRKWEEWGTELVAWDLDGTLIDTRSVFVQRMFEATGALLYGNSSCWEKKDSREFERVRQASEYLDKIVWRLRPEFGVNPVIMTMAMSILAENLGAKGGDDRYLLAQDKIRQVYEDDIPPLFPGALEAMELVRRSGVRSVLATHSEEPWAWRKLYGNNLVGVFERVICFQVGKSKSGQWGSGFEKLRVDPKRVLVFGDNLEADIIPVLHLGARAVWINRGRSFGGEQESRELVNQKRMIEVNSIQSVIRAIID